MEVDADNPEDVSELEARLYGQIHHGPVSEKPESFDQNRTGLAGSSSEVSKEVDDPPKRRYWNKGQQYYGSKKHINIFAGSSQIRENPVVKSSIPSKEVKPFRPYIPYLSKNEVIPSASGDDPEPKGSSSQINTGENSGGKNVFPEKNIEKTGGNFFPFRRNMARLSKALKYQLKKMRANQAREKQKQQKRPIETIVVESSDDEDDVIEIPVPAPPTVTIDSSGESDIECKDSPTFLKPKELMQSDDKVNSRCVSPSSVMSDDFIGQSDRSRILQHKNIADDEDLVYVQETVDSFVYQSKSKGNSSINDQGNKNLAQKSDFVTPKKKNNIKEKPDYNVTQSNFRAIDVYESESSDMPDNDKEKDNVPLKAISGTDETIDKERTKKLKKRRKSGSARESEPNDDSTDSEGQSSAKTGVPFIARGEAVENYKSNNGKTVRYQPVADANTSDNEFINMLANIAQGKDSPDNSSESDKSVHSYEDITARIIAEDVLNKKKRSNVESSSRKSKTGEKVEAVPLDTSADIDKILEGIDKMQSVEEPSESVDEKEEVDEYTGDEEMLSLTDAINNPKFVQNSQTDNGLYIVHSHGKYIGWTEEMVRFYDWSWGQNQFNVKHIRKLMDASAKWNIYTEDMFPKARRFSNLKCFNCCEFGHIRARCPKPRKPLVCYMCGETGHQEPRCPNTICLRCGNKTNVFTRICNVCSHQKRLICPICKIRGHSTQLCPDKWRRYHSTTQPNEYPNKTVQYNERKFCCICAGQDHWPEHCRSAVRFLEYPQSVSEIKSYAKSYDDDLIKFPYGRNVTGYALISRPCDSVLFKFSSEITIKQYYGRFLNAVGLDYLMTWTRKRKVSKNNNELLFADEPKNKTKKKNLVLNPFAKEKKLNKKSNEEKAECSSNKIEENVPEQEISDDIVLNISDNKTQEEETLAIPHCSKASPPESSSTKPSDEVQEENKLDETTNAYVSFSENIIDNQSTPNEKTKCRKLDPLPDFIPLNYSDDEDEEMENEEMENEEMENEEVGISMKLDSKHDVEPDTVSNNEDVPCEGKIYLSKFHSGCLLSPKGQKFLVENSKKFNVKYRFQWSPVGHILIIDGLPSNQDKFHHELMETFRNLSDQKNRKQLEKSQKVPKRKDVLIKFLQENILQLHKNLGNVIDLYKRLQDVQNAVTKASWRIAEKTRRTLNMILMGQTGLRKGKANLEALMKHLKTLQENDSMEVVPDTVRDQIGEHWKYIFSSQQHENYEELVEQYKELKKNNKLPKLNLNYRLLGGKVLDVSLTDEQKQKLNKDTNVEEPKFVEKEEKVEIPVTKLKNEEQVKKSNPVPCESPKNPSKEPNVTPSGSGFQSRSFLSDRIRGDNRGWKNLLNHLSKPRLYRKNLNNQATTPSIFWSRECIKFIDECLAMNPPHQAVVSKLYRVQEKAKQGLLSHNDYKSLLSIFNVLNGQRG